MPTIEEAKQALQQQRQVAAQTRQQLEAERSKLPDVGSQRALRQQLAGLQGRAKRRVIAGKGEEIEGQIQRISTYEAEVLTPYEKQIQEAEQAQQEYERQVAAEQQAISTARTYFRKGIPASLVKGDPAYEYLRKLEISEGAMLTTMAPQKEYVLEPIASTGEVYLEPIQYSDYAKAQLIKEGLTIPESKKLPAYSPIKLEPIRDISGKPIEYPVGSIAVTEPKKFKGEMYSSQLGAYIAPSPTGYGSTGYIRPPTISERSSMITGNILTTSLSELRKEYRAYEKSKKRVGDIGKELNKYKDSIDSSGNWIGSEKDLEKYNALIEEYQANLPATQITYRAGIGKTVEVPISELKYISKVGEGTPGEITGLVQGVGKTIGGTLGGILRDTLPKEGVATLKGYKTTIFQPQLSGTIQTDPKTGKPLSSMITLDVPDRKILTSSQGEKAGKFIGEVIPYVNPYGGYIFASEQLGRFGENIKQSGGIVSGGVSYFKESPVESTIAVTLGAGYIIGKGIKLVRGRPEKYLAQPESKIVDIKAQSRVDIERTLRRKPLVELTYTDDVSRLSAVNRGKGRISVTEITPKSSFKGKTIEFIGIRGKVKKVTGAVDIEKGVYREFIPLEGRYAKYVEIQPSGQGTITIFRGNKAVLRREITSSLQSDLLSTPKIKTTKIIIDKQRYTPLQQTSIDLKAGKRAKTASIVTSEEKVVLSERPLKFASKRVSGEVETITKTMKDKGIFKITEETAGFSDIVTSGERKGMLRVKSDKGTITLRKKVAQEIVAGQDLEIDRTLSIAAGGKETTKKLVSPKVTRQVTQFQESRVLYGYGLKEPPTEVLRNQKIVEAIRQLNKENEMYVKSLKKEASKIKATKGTLDIIPSVSAQPTYVGGSGGQASESIYQFNKELDIPSKVYVEPVTLSIPRSQVVSPSIPSNIQIIPTTKLGGVGTTGIALSKVDMVSAGQFGDLKIINRVEPTQVQELKLETVSMTENVNVSNVLKPALELSPQSKIKSQTRQDVKTDLKLDLKSETKLQTAQKSMQKQRSTQRQETRTSKTLAKIKTNLKIPLPSLGKALTKVRTMAKEEGFEAIGIRYGKEVSLGKGTKQEVSKGLSRFLTGTLGASGFLRRTSGEKLRAEETGLLRDISFRKSKVSPFLVVEKRSKRLRKGTTAREIQAFRPGKRSKMLFNL